MRRLAAPATFQTAQERLRVYLAEGRERPQNLARVARAQHRDRAFIDFLDLHRIHELLQKIRMLIDIRAQLGHALRAQAVEQLDQLARVQLPKSDRHVLKEMSIPLLAIAQRFLRPLARGDVHHRAHELQSARFIDQGMGHHIEVLD